MKRLILWIKGLGKKKVKVETQEEFYARIRRLNAGRMTILKISERMRARPERLKAEEKRQRRNILRAKINKTRHKLVEVLDDDEYGPKPPRMSFLEAKVKL